MKPTGSRTGQVARFDLDGWLPENSHTVTMLLDEIAEPFAERRGSIQGFDDRDAALSGQARAGRRQDIQLSPLGVDLQQIHSVQ